MAANPFMPPPSDVPKSVLTWDRLALLHAIAQSGGTATFQALRVALDLSPSGLNNHLAKLERARLIRIAKGYANNRPLTQDVLTPGGLELLRDTAERMRAFVADEERRRSALERAVAANNRTLDT